VKRVERLLPDYFGTADTEYTRAVSLYWWTAHAGRALEPGCKADMAVVLDGPQGIGKSTGVAAMVPDGLHVEINFAAKDADLSRLIKGKLGGEFAELRGLATRDLESIKVFFVRTHEEFVDKFQVFPTRFPRRLVFVGTTNSDSFLADETGNRRFLPVKVLRHVDVEAIKRDRLQLWAEARELFNAHGVMWQDAERLARAEHGAYRVGDVWEPAIARWLDSSGPGGTKWRDQEFSIADVLEHAVHKFPREQSRADEMRAARVLRHFGFESCVVKISGVSQRRWRRV
jgi:predicted P-loop ATPase